MARSRKPKMQPEESIKATIEVTDEIKATVETPKTSPEYLTEIPPGDILAKRADGDQVIVVTKDGRKLTVKK